MKKLLFSITKKDFIINWFSGKGAGGQSRNKNQNCVRLKHKETGIITTGQSEKSQRQNLKNAFRAMYNNTKFKLWLYRKIYEYDDPTAIDNKVDEAMKPKNLKIEYLGEKS